MVMLELFPILLFFIAFFGMLRTDNIVKAIVCVMMMQTAVIMFWLGIGARSGVIPPIIQDLSYLDYLETIADPLPQALMITAIIIGIAVTAINITMLNTLFKKFRTIEWTDMEAMHLEDDDIDRVE
jgi:multicomponent Na+:H+ antiporter subunit C